MSGEAEHSGEQELPEDRPCAICGANPAAGFVSIWAATTGDVWFCHGDEDDEPTCYERRGATGAGSAAYLADLLASPAQCQAKDFSGETWCSREVVVGRNFCWSHLPSNPPGQPARGADHNPREEADKGARAGERGAEG